MVGKNGCERGNNSQVEGMAAVVEVEGMEVEVEVVAVVLKGEVIRR